MDVGALFVANAETLFRYLVRLTGDEDRASDALQEAFLAAVERPPSREVHLRAWLFTVATNAVRQTLRAASRHARLLAEHQSADWSEGPADSPQDAAEGAERRRLVRRALLTLNDKERTALLLRAEGFKHQEIAEAVGTTTKAVGTLLARAMRKLAAELAPVRDQI